MKTENRGNGRVFSAALFATSFVVVAFFTTKAVDRWSARTPLPNAGSAAPQVSFLNQTVAGDIALANLHCGALDETNEVEMRMCLETLNQWAQRVQSETQRHLYKFRVRPAEFENSEGYFRMLMMAVVLYEDFGIRYNPNFVSAPNGSVTDYSFFDNPRDVFIGGLLGDWRMGTCSSMPVLYIAIGRRLGYPLKLVTTKAHLFIRWEGSGERFDLEATGKGMNRYDDEHYKQWPFPVTEEEIAADGHLKSLTPDEELAVFLSIRGHCLMARRQYPAAETCYSQAAQLAPSSRGYRLLEQNASRLTQLAGKENP